MRNRRGGAPLLLAAVSALALAASLLATAPAVAARCEGAPGLSAVQQYCESIPSAGGDRSTLGSVTSGSGASSGNPYLLPQGVRPAVLRQLRQSGVTGRELAARLAASGSGGSDRSRRLVQPPVQDEASASGGFVSAVSQFGRSLGTLGALAAAGLVLVGVALVASGARRRGPRPDADD